MRFHVMSIPLSAEPESPAGPEYDRLVDLACAAEAHGFDGFWIAEHHFNRYGGVVPLAGVLLAHLAARTHTLRLGTAAAILPLRDPQTTVEEFAMVDALSGGRLELGVGRGFVAPEFAGRGVDMAERSSRFTAGLQAIEAYLSGAGPADPRIDGDGNGPDLLPRPVQPRVPVWLAVSTSLESCQHAGTAGHGLMLNPYNRSDDEVDAAIDAYLTAWRSAGHPDTLSPRILANQIMYAATSTEEAERQARPAVDSYLAGVQQSFKPTGGMSLSSHGFDDLYPGKLLVGTPDLLREKIRDWQRRGVTDISVMSHFGCPVVAHADESLKLFATEVMPHVAAVPEEAAVR